MLLHHMVVGIADMTSMSIYKPVPDVEIFLN